jgi:hypothetical protein
MSPSNVQFANWPLKNGPQLHDFECFLSTACTSWKGAGSQSDRIGRFFSFSLFLFFSFLKRGCPGWGANRGPLNLIYFLIFTTLPLSHSGSPIFFSLLLWQLKYVTKVAQEFGILVQVNSLVLVLRKKALLGHTVGDFFLQKIILGHPVGSAPDDNNGHVTCSA